MRRYKTTIVLMICAMTWSGLVSAEYFRWKDKNGNTQYGDQVPAEEVNSGRSLLDESGQVVEEVSPARSPEEQKRYEEQQRIAKMERQRREEQDAYDCVLLATFNSPEQILEVRDERINLIEQSINMSRERLRKQQQELAKLNESRNRFIERDMEPPEWIDTTELKVLSRIGGIEEYINDKAVEKDRLRKKFGEDIERYKELTKRAVTSR